MTYKFNLQLSANKHN